MDGLLFLRELTGNKLPVSENGMSTNLVYNYYMKNSVSNNHHLCFHAIMKLDQWKRFQHKCMYIIQDITDALAAILLSTHSSGILVPATSHPAAAQTTAT